MNRGEHFELAGVYSCTVDNCDGKGGDCIIQCEDWDGLITCTGEVPRRTSALSPELKQVLGLPKGGFAVGASLSGSASDVPVSDVGSGQGGGTGGGVGGTSSTSNAGANAGSGGGVIY